MNTVQKSIIVTVIAIVTLRLGFQFSAPYRVLANRVKCGPWIAALFSKPADHPCRLAASGRIKGALIEAALALVLAFLLAVFIGARGSGGPPRGGEPPDDRPKTPKPSPAKTTR